MEISPAKGLKILFVSHEYKIGGSSVSLCSMISGIREAYPDVNYDVVIPYKRNSEVKKFFHNVGIEFKEVLYRNNHKKVGDIYKFKYILYDVINKFANHKIKRIISTGKYDLVCSNSSAVSVGAIAAFSVGIPHIQYVREMMEEDFNIEYRNPEEEKKVFENSDGVIFISNHVKNKYLKLYKIKNYAQFFNGFEVENYYIENHSILTQNCVNIAQIGAFKDGKGTKSTINIMRLLKERGNKNIKLSLVGRGDRKYVSEMEDMIKENSLEDCVKIVDYTNSIKDILRKTDIVIVNSVSEGFGRVTIESMLGGCVVIGRNAGGTTEIIDDNRNGILFEDEMDAVNKIETIIETTGKSREIAKEGQRFAVSNFGIEKVANNFISFCQQVLGD